MGSERRRKSGERGVFTLGQKDWDLDWEAVKDCLLAFIGRHKDDALIRGLPLDSQSVIGRRVREREDLWFLGDWVIQGAPFKFEAKWSMEIAPGQSTRIMVFVERIEERFVIKDWDLKETF